MTTSTKDPKGCGHRGCTTVPSPELRKIPGLAAYCANHQGEGLRAALVVVPAWLTAPPVVPLAVTDAERDAENKCDDCCPTIGCSTCGPCSEHDDPDTAAAATADPEPEWRGYSGHATTGSKYDRSLSAVQIAKGVRADIKDAITTGDLPGKGTGFTYSVRSEYFSGGQAVRIEVAGPDGDAWAYRPVTEDDSGRVQAEGARTLTDQAQQIGVLLHQLGRAYVYDDTDAQIDHFHTSCYVGASLAGGSTLPSHIW